MKLKKFLNASMILAFLAVSQTALAQAFTVQGRVVDESGEPMIGVAVTNKDGNTLGVTDADGRYSIELNSPTKLKFTFVGSETITIDAKKAAQKDIVMRQTATALDDVVVVGYGTQKKNKPYRCRTEHQQQGHPQSQRLQRLFCPPGHRAGTYSSAELRTAWQRPGLSETQRTGIAQLIHITAHSYRRRGGRLQPNRPQQHRDDISS